MSMYGAGYVATGSDPISVIVSDLVGKPHSKITADSVVAQSAIRLQDDVVVLSKQKFTRHQTEHTRFILDLLKVKPDRGLYKIAISVGSSSASMTVRVLGDVAVDNIEFGVSDVDGVAAPKMNSVAYPKKHANVLEADSQQKYVHIILYCISKQFQLKKLSFLVETV